ARPTSAPASSGSPATSCATPLAASSDGDRKRQRGTDRFAEPVDAAQRPPAARNEAAIEQAGVEQRADDVARGVVPDGEALRRAVDGPPRIPSGGPDGGRHA